MTGATGYVGGRLLKALESRDEHVRCLAREPGVLAQRVVPKTEIARGDLLDPSSLIQPLEGTDTAYYLLHSLGTQGDFEALEESAARNFAAAAKAAGVRRIIFLGGLFSADSPLCQRRVGEILRESGVPTIEFRASIIIGSGSLSFELIRSLVQRLPIMVTPRWISVPAQPIAISDVLAYLIAALDLPSAEHSIYEIGGADRMSYGDVMLEFARFRGLRRFLLPTPLHVPRLSSLWLSLVTPVYARIGRKLIDSMTAPSMVSDDSSLRDFAIRPMGIRDAIEQALDCEDQEFAETYWADAASLLGARRSWSGVTFGPRLVDSRTASAPVSPEEAFEPIRRIGGKNGWYYGNWLWQLRGLMDLLVGGVGMHRGRRDSNSLRVGDVVDCWRVEAYDPPRKLTLAAEMKLPGRGWLQFEVEPNGAGSKIIQTAMYDPVGLLGILYWYFLCPVHHFLFVGMINNIVRACSRDKTECCRTSHETNPP